MPYLYWDAVIQVSGSDFTTTSASLVSVTGLSYGLAASSLYEIEGVLKIQNSGTGTKFGMAYSAAGATGEMLETTNTTQSSTINPCCINIGGGATTTARSMTNNTDSTSFIKAMITTGANTGNVSIQVLSVTGTTTVYAGSVMKIKKLV